MLSLSPAKLLVILVIALIVLGPEKLPQVARQIGAAWHDLRQWRSRIESEVRGTFPNLPPTHEVAQVVRSPLAFLDRLADEHERALKPKPSEPEARPTTVPTPRARHPHPSRRRRGGDGSYPARTGPAPHQRVRRGGASGVGAAANGSNGRDSPASNGDGRARRSAPATPAPGAGSRAVPDDPSMN